MAIIFQKTPLHHAVTNDDVFNLTKLLDDGADPNAQVTIKATSSCPICSIIVASVKITSPGW